MNQPKYADELPHGAQVYNFIHDKWDTVHNLTVYPGYHMIIAFFVNFFGFDQFNYYRLISMLLCLFFSLLLFPRVTEGRVKLVVMFFLVPFALPFFFLLYTDILGLIFILWMYYLATKKNYIGSGIYALFAVLCRQNNIIWVVYILVYILIEHYDFKIKDMFLDSKKFLYFILPFIFIGIMLIIYGSFTPGDFKAHNLNTVSFGNFILFFFLFFMMFLPYMLKKVIELYNFNMDKIGIYLMYIVLTALGIFFFKGDHPYNQYNIFLHNMLVLSMENILVKFIIIFISVVCGFSLFMFKFKGMKFNTILLFFFTTLIFFSISWMIEFRYMLIPFYLLMFMIKDELIKDKESYWYTIIYWIFINIIMLYGIINWKIFW
jgi:hypothetical protein